MFRVLRVVPLTIALLFAAACGDDAENPGSDGGNGSQDASADAGIVDIGVHDAAEVPARCTAPEAVDCTDEQIQTLLLLDKLNTGEITLQDTTGGVYTYLVDARAGGLTPTESFVYAKFAADGLEKVDITDEQSFDSMDWDIAFRRFVVRVNSGVSGPSCTEVARVPQADDLEDVPTTPENLTFNEEQYFSSDTCDLIPDGSGMPTSPAVALGSYWSYSMCLQMTKNVFIIQLANGSNVKFQVQSYYNEPGAQDACNATGTVPQPSGSAQLVIKWAFVP